MKRMQNQQFNEYFNQLLVQDEQQMNLSSIFTDGCQQFQNKIIQCLNVLNLEQLNYFESNQEEIDEAEDYLEQGCDYYEKNDYENAIIQFDKGLDLNKNDITLLYYKGEQLRLISKFKESIECFDKALLIDPHNLIVLIGKNKIQIHYLAISIQTL